jgi:hypothetical protein
MKPRIFVFLTHWSHTIEIFSEQKFREEPELSQDKVNEISNENRELKNKNKQLEEQNGYLGTMCQNFENMVNVFYT